MELVVKIVAQKEDDKALKQFILAVNKDINELNKTIERYNQATQLEKKVQLIGQIAQHQKVITDKYPDKLISLCPQFQQEFQQKLFKNISHEMTSLGLKEQRVAEHSSHFFSVSDYHRLSKAKTHFAALANTNKTKFNQGFEYFFGATRVNKEDNYKLAIKSFIIEMAKEPRVELFYNKLWQLKSLLHTAIPEQKVSLERASKLLTLITLIDDKIRCLQVDYPEIRQNSWAKKTNCAELIAQMEPEKLTLFMLSLEKGPGFELSQLDDLYLPGEIGYEMLRTFLDNHSICFLGGINSKNFQLTNNTNGAEFVLKIDNRLDAPRNLETRLMARVLSQTITPIYAQRQATYTNHRSETKTRVLLLTEFCQGGNLEEHAMSYTDNDSRLRSAVSIYRQMAETLEVIRLNKVSFLDMKNTNWLMDLQGTLKIADTKSFLPLVNGLFNANVKESMWFAPVSTRYMNPPELFDFKGVFTADAVHAYQLGKNLYQYLLKGDKGFTSELSYLYKRHDGAEYNFDYPIFQTDIGIRLKDLLCALIKPMPKNRCSVAQALVSLNELDKMLNPNASASKPSVPDPATSSSFFATQPPADRTAVHDLELECHCLLNDVQQFKLNSRDILMSKYLADAQGVLAHLPQQSIPSQVKVVTELKQQLIRARDSVSSFEPTKIKEVIYSLRAAGTTGWMATIFDFFSINKITKADRVESAFLAVPIEQRGRAFTNSDAVREALAMHRHFGRRFDVYRNVDNSLDEHYAAHSFKELLTAVRDHEQQHTSLSPC